jgi:serine/threonine-protein kinase RsbW
VAVSFEGRELHVPADYGRLPEVRRFAADAATAFGLGRTEAHDVTMALSEAVANAVEHGSPSAGDEIEIQALAEADALVLYVRDRGRFVPRVAPRGELPERGRGLRFMTELMDEVDVRPGSAGTVVRLVKRRRAG